MPEPRGPECTGSGEVVTGSLERRVVSETRRKKAKPFCGVPNLWVLAKASSFRHMAGWSAERREVGHRFQAVRGNSAETRPILWGSLKIALLRPHLA